MFVGGNPASLHLAHNDIGPVGSTYVAREVLNHQLLYIDISHNAIKSDGCVAVMNKLGAEVADSEGNPGWSLRCKSCRTMNLRFNDIDEACTDMLCVSNTISSSHSSLSRVIKYMTGNRMSSKSMKNAFGVMFPTMTAQAVDALAKVSICGTNQNRSGVWERWYGKQHVNSAYWLSVIEAEKVIDRAHERSFDEGSFKETFRCMSNVGAASMHFVVNILGPKAPYLRTLQLHNMHFTISESNTLAECFDRSPVDILHLNADALPTAGKALLERRWAQAGKPRDDGSLKGLYV